MRETAVRAAMRIPDLLGQLDRPAPVNGAQPALAGG
jgi:hypothetical protein